MFNPRSMLNLKSIITKTAAAIAFSVAATANAAVIHDEINMVQGSRFSTTELSIENSGEYKLNLTDFNFGSSFDNLMVSLTTATDVILGQDGEEFFIDYENLESVDGIYTDSWLFDVDPGNYFLTLWADTGSSSNIGLYGVRLESLRIDSNVIPAVPLPSSVILFLSAAGLLFRNAKVKKVKRA